ncbi:preprotein translocase subunit SecD [Methanofollis liminatans DSM 4140]|uniref:Protein-export membrane protein SecD n=1 Tax=Methanofollis liminatans DSM 4140 TaxID=28892 RepID=J1L2E8_9EURY|nr:preprotein translocase subunit SecD [Methanofollis liminatans]EJG07232.1 preprotein translocase subunit SecD [Methanofollis liminatans DSM 4140]
MSNDTLRKLMSDWRVVLLVVLVAASIVAIGPHFEDGKFTTNLQYGLDLQEGSWLQMEFQAEVLTVQTDRSIDRLAENLSRTLDTEVIVAADDQIEIRKKLSQEELQPILLAEGATIVTYNPGVSKETAEDVKRILENKVNSLGTKDARVNILTSLNGVTRYVRVELAGVDMATANEVVGQQGKFEIRVQTAGSESQHVLFGDAVTSVSVPTVYPPGSDMWGVAFTLSEAGAVSFREAAISSNAVNDPDNHELIMLLDNTTVYSAPLSPDLAAKLKVEPIRELRASTGTGDAGMQDALNLEIHLRAGALPVDVTVAGSGSVSATLGDYFKIVAFAAAALALIVVGVVVYFRYREPSIVLPMIAINLAEIIILLGIARYIQQLDLASIAGIIAVMGTGIDQLVVITDEVLYEGRVPSPSVYLKRLARALGIIVVAASTTFIAMLPLALMDLSTLRGFAIITILGVLIGVLVTRPAYGKIIMAILSK